MTLGQKLKALLKDNSMTQEDLAERLEVSRQAVGKWVNDKGIPEVGKLVQISNLFGVSMDYLLKEDYEEKNAISNSGYYVSQEMLDGYLSYSRQNVKQITGGISLFILSNVFECFGHHSMIMTFLFWLTMIAGIIIIIWYYFQTTQYPPSVLSGFIFLFYSCSDSFASTYPQVSWLQTSLFPFSTIYSPHFGHLFADGFCQDMKSHSGLSSHP